MPRPSHGSHVRVPRHATSLTWLPLPATKGFEIGSGFGGTVLRGSQHNDPFKAHPSGAAGLLQATSNNAGGTLGGITSGSDLMFRVAVKPVSTIGCAQARGPPLAHALKYTKAHTRTA